MANQIFVNHTAVNCVADFMTGTSPNSLSNRSTSLGATQAAVEVGLLAALSSNSIVNAAQSAVVTSLTDVCVDGGGDLTFYSDGGAVNISIAIP